MKSSHVRGIERIEERSPAVQLVDLVWRMTGVRSWIRLNHTMQDALALAIKSGLHFEPGDIELLYRSFNGHRWFGDCEWVFRLAVQRDNVPACVSYEQWVKRDPFILDGRRLYVGAPVDFKHLVNAEGRTALVTSFAKDGMSLIVCTYPEAHYLGRAGEEMVWPSGKPLRRITLGLYDVRNIERARVKARKAAKEAESA